MARAHFIPFMNHLIRTIVLVGLTATPLLAKTNTLASTSATKKTSIAANPYLGAIVVDAATGKVLFEDKADARGIRPAPRN